LIAEVNQALRDKPRAVALRPGVSNASALNVAREHLFAAATCCRRNFVELAPRISSRSPSPPSARRESAYRLDAPGGEGERDQTQEHLMTRLYFDEIVNMGRGAGRGRI
jgi:hypothetical protein